jgi:hypothetical protein
VSKITVPLASLAGVISGVLAISTDNAAPRSEPLQARGGTPSKLVMRVRFPFARSNPEPGSEPPRGDSRRKIKKLYPGRVPVADSRGRGRETCDL